MLESHCQHVQDVQGVFVKPTTTNRIIMILYLIVPIR